MNVAICTADRALRIERPLLVVVEGQNDVEFLCRFSRLLAAVRPEIAELRRLADEGRLVFIPFGGGSPIAWATQFTALCCPEVHLYDRESGVEREQRLEAAGTVNLRETCCAFVTGKRSVENYLHPAAIAAAGGGDVAFGDSDSVGAVTARSWLALQSEPRPWDALSRRGRLRLINRAKRWLNSVVVDHMTPELLAERDPAGEVATWLSTITSMACE